MLFHRVAILGVGLVGASFALALREKSLCKAISGFGRNEHNLRRARQQGMIDDYRMDAGSACQDADLVVLATPVGVFKALGRDIGSALKPGVIVTDVGSVKGRLVYDLEASMPEGAYYVGSHPIAGGDRSGIDDARADLFHDARCIITPTEHSDAGAVQKIASLWEGIGSRVESMDPVRHDQIYAAVSHLPHIMAYALVNIAHAFDSECIDYAGPGFKDTTRIALSMPEIWRDIAILNKDNLIKLIDGLRENLGKIEKMLVSEDAAGIEREFSESRQLRMRLSDGSRRGHDERAGSSLADSGG